MNQTKINKETLLNDTLQQMDLTYILNIPLKTEYTFFSGAHETNILQDRSYSRPQNSLNKFKNMKSYHAPFLITAV